MSDVVDHEAQAGNTDEAVQHDGTPGSDDPSMAPVSRDVSRHALTLPGLPEDIEVDPLSEAQLRSAQARRVFEATGQAEAWMDDYFTLTAEGWPWRQAAYMIWAAQPAERRWPETQADLAEVLGLSSDRAIREWKAKNPMIEATIVKLTTSTLGKHRAEVLEALVQSARVVDYKHHPDRKLLLEMTGDYVPKQAVTVGPLVTQEDFEQADAADLAALARVPGVEVEDDEGDG